MCIRVSAVSRLLVHIDALVLIPSTGFKENFLRFSERTTNGHNKKEQTTTDDTDSTDAGSAQLARLCAGGSRECFGGLAEITS